MIRSVRKAMKREKRVVVQYLGLPGSLLRPFLVVIIGLLLSWRSLLLGNLYWFAGTLVVFWDGALFPSTFDFLLVVVLEVGEPFNSIGTIISLDELSDASRGRAAEVLPCTVNNGVSLTNAWNIS